MPRRFGNGPWELTVPDSTRGEMAKTLNCDPNGEVTKQTSAHVQMLAKTGVTGTPMALAAFVREYVAEFEEKAFSKGQSKALSSATAYLRELHYEHLYFIELLEKGQFLVLLNELKELSGALGRFKTKEEIELEATEVAIEQARIRWATD